MSREQTRTAMRFAPLAGGTLCATLLATTALAQPAPNAHPMGGQVAAGQASISQSASATTINQSTPRAVVNWQSFDVGANQSVQFVQPSATSTTLNRVLSPDPSQIAGRITANGQIVLQNQSGVVFAKGAQVDAASLVVSAPGITDQNFMAGKMVFDVPASPNAQIVNNGRITVKQSGLAALVAPQVANNGVITAKMGHVVLAGAQAETVDLYGDGMLSINVTGQVTQAPVGPDGQKVTALVTNSGVVAAPGGTVQLTASAVDGIVQTLVTAGGHIAAPSVGGQTGKVVVSGVGGSVIVAGDVSAAGRAPGTTGGAIKVNASNGVTLAAGARIDASGATGGGTIAIGTTLARARGGPSVASTHTAATATIAKGALVTASATQSGNGGTVVVLSSQSTSVSGEIDARGGKLGGNGGHVEMSGQTGFAFDGKVDVTAQTPTGLAGTILIDPRDLYISSTNPVTLNEASSDTTLTSGTPASSPGSLPGSSTDAWVTPTSINSLSGAVTLTATRDLDVLTALNTTGSGITALTLNAGRNLIVYAGASMTTAGSLTLTATNALVTNATLTAGGSIALIDTYTTGTLPNGITHAFTLNDPVTAGTGQTISFSVPSGYNFYSASAPNGTLEIGPATAAAAANFGIGVGASAGFNETTVRIGTTSLPGALVAANIQLGNSTYGPNVNNYGSAKLDLHATGTVTEYSTSAIEAAALTGSVGTLNLPNSGNNFATLGPFNATGNITLANSGTLTLGGAVAATGNVTLTSNGSLFVSAPLGAGGNIALTAEDSLIANATITAGGNIALTDLFNSGSPPNGYSDGMVLNDPVTAGTGKTISLSIAGGDQFNKLVASQGTVEKGPSTAQYEANFGTNNNLPSNLVANVVRIGTTSLPNALVATSLVFSGTNNFSTATLDLHSTGAVTQAAGSSIAAAALTGSVGSLDLPNTGNGIGTLGPLTATGNIALTTSGSLTVAMPVNTPGGITLISGGSLFVNEPLIAGGNIALTAEDSLIANATVTADGSVAMIDHFKSGSAPAGYTYGMTLNDLVTAGTGQTISYQVAGGFFHYHSVAPGGTIEIGPGSAGEAANFVVAVGDGAKAFEAATVRIGTTSLPGALVATDIQLGNANHPGLNNYGAATLELHATGAVTQYAGSSIEAAGVAGSVGSLTLANSGNSFATVGPLGATGDVTLATTGPLTFDGTLTANTLNVTTPGLVTQTGASAIIVAALTGSVGSLDLFGPNNIAALGALSAPAYLELNTSGPLAINGPLTSSDIAIGAVGSITLAGNIVFPANGGTSPVASFSVSPASDGTSSFTQTGTTQVVQQGAGTSLFLVSLDGPSTFNDLEAPATRLSLFSGGGAISGTVNVGSLDLSTDGAGSSSLTGSTVGGLTGSQAAAATTADPAVNPAYLVNGCEAGAGCVVTPPPTPTPTPPPEPPTPTAVATPPTNTPPPAPIVNTTTPPAPAPEPVITEAELQAAANVATNIVVATPVVTGVSNAVDAIALGALAPDDSDAAGTVETATSTTGPVGTEEAGPTRTQQRGVPLVNPLGEMSRGPLRNRSADPDLVVPNVSERDY